MHRVVQRELSPSPEVMILSLFHASRASFLPMFPWPSVALPVPYNAVAVEKASLVSLARRSLSLSRRRRRASSLDRSIAETVVGFLELYTREIYGVKI